ncbi:hypothetical protein [Acinetobacter sp. TGL-Y2]|nr:hypothetical protein [Acinetobacter sp. TGL-Y2]
MGLSKPTDDVGQQAKDNLHKLERQVSTGVFLKMNVLVSISAPASEGVD